MERLPARIDPIRLADDRGRLCGTVPLAAMTRLAGLCIGDTSEAELDLMFGRDEEGLRRLRGIIRAEMTVTCQRCLEPLVLELISRLDLVLLQPGELDAGPGDRRDALTVAGPMVLAEIVEEELLLVLPMHSAHGDPPCRTPVGSSGVTAAPHPFAALKPLSRRSGKD